MKEAVVNLLYKHPESAKKIIERIAFNEKLRKELSAVKKEAKEKQKKISFKIPKLRDRNTIIMTSRNLATETMIFLTEGDSASASIVASRDPMTQAVFSLRGKPLNVFGMKMDQLYKNEEMFNLMSALEHRRRPGKSALQQSNPRNGCGCGRDAYPQSSNDFFSDLF